ncbi:hypothetical protein AB0929_07740 [Streptomyces massasporeus]|uniref:hypothetical protein n=1 Tax=Streptomyces massasporeus TaxID=67324 RepID=UPI003454298D
MAVAPDGPEDTATSVPEGVITCYGSEGDQGDCVLDSASGRAYLIRTAEPDDVKSTQTSVSEIAPVTGKPRRTVGDAPYIPLRRPSVYTVDVRDL